jgi:hypothetical protein
LQLACPTCAERYRIEPARFPARRVRASCVACGEPLFLRLVAAGPRTAESSGGVETLAQEEVPLWRQPQPIGPGREVRAQAPPAAGLEATAVPAEASTFAQPPVEDRPGFSFARVGDVSARAQRLARALVSDILVYHPKKVDLGLREGNLKELVREQVEKSWDEYCERLGEEQARLNRAHFVRALNDILARGNPVF